LRFRPGIYIRQQQVTNSKNNYQIKHSHLFHNLLLHEFMKLLNALIFLPGHISSIYGGEGGDYVVKHAQVLDVSRFGRVIMQDEKPFLGRDDVELLFNHHKFL